MIPPPPISTPFPTRRSSDLFDPSNDPALYEEWAQAGLFHADANRSTRVGGDREPFTIVIPPRSEEHTSELQSHVNLVCRLLLEKKKDTQLPRVRNFILH